MNTSYRYTPILNSVVSFQKATRDWNKICYFQLRVVVILKITFRIGYNEKRLLSTHPSPKAEITDFHWRTYQHRGELSTRLGQLKRARQRVQVKTDEDNVRSAVWVQPEQNTVHRVHVRRESIYICIFFFRHESLLTLPKVNCIFLR